jgi:hypothetical protein
MFDLFVRRPVSPTGKTPAMPFRHGTRRIPAHHRRIAPTTSRYATRQSRHYLTSTRRTVFDAVRSIVAEMANREFRVLMQSLKKITYKQLVTDNLTLKLRHFRTFLSPAAPHHSSQKLAYSHFRRT